MGIKTLILFAFVISILSLNAQEFKKDNAWDVLLNDVKIRYFYSLKNDALMPKPKFGKKLKEMDGKTISIRGFFLPVDVTGNVYILSFNPMNMCFFCTGDGLQTIIELDVLPDHVRRFKRLRTDNFFEVKGKLKLNSDDPEHPIYILKEVELVKLIK